jgi:hypothetical protein
MLVQDVVAIVMEVVLLLVHLAIVRLVVKVAVAQLAPISVKATVYRIVKETVLRAVPVIANQAVQELQVLPYLNL